MEQTIQTNPTPNTPTTTSSAIPEKKSKTGCYIAGGLGCLWLIIIVVLAAVGIGYYFYQEYQKDVYWNTYYNSMFNENYNYDVNDNFNENINENVNADLPDDVTITDSGEIIGADGVSLGFIPDPIDTDLYAYQAGANATQHFSDTEWPSMRVTIENKKVLPMIDDNDTGSLWVGAVLDNGYFIQVGINSSTETDSNGDMRWNYFWQMWDDKDNYKYGLQEPLDNYDWYSNDKNTFTLTCQDPDNGDWEFWVNGNVVGKTNTGSCAMDVYNTSIFWELTTDKNEISKLPTFGPFTLSNFEYWDGYDWQPVNSVSASYGFGKVINGTESNQDAVCPPYGLAVGDNKTLIAGSTVSCLPIGQTIWN